ncbi:MAG: glycoside hydrolase family 18 protein [Bacillota bacterium]|nr:glycoside hydrolase family 18 protein [Bacillota bacterium]
MDIYVVKPGDSLWTISRRYGVTTQAIIDINQLQNFPHLVVGQALVIPTQESAYRVVPGDSLWSISRKFNVSVASIAALNGITNPSVIHPGMIIRIPQQSKNFGYIEANGYLEPTTPEKDTQRVDEVGNYLTYLSLFSYQVNADGTLKALNDDAALAAARNHRNAPLMVITNFEGGTFSTDLGHTILSSDSIQQNLIANVLSTMKSKGFYGLNIDFERIPPSDRELYNNFLRKVVTALHAQNYVVCTALAPKTSGQQTGAWYGAHDYPAHGQIVDFVIIMTYEWGWSGGPPMPVAPIDQVRAVLNYAVSVIPAKKIMMGMPLYGYDWTLPYMPHGSFAPRVSPQDAIGIAIKYNAEISYDMKSQSPSINYYDEKGTAHIIWFEDARSVRAKFLLASRLGLRGVSYWELGSPFPQNWAILNDMFNIEKVV